jgi:hypothetical protein
VESDLPRGGQARAVWRSLSPQARAEAFAAASRGAAPADLGVAWAAAGYGRMVSRRLRIVRLLAPFGFVVLAVPIGALLVVYRASTSAVDVTMTVLLVAILGGLVALSLWARRFQRLYSSGLLGIEASRLGSPGPSSAPSAWAVVPGESEFTVPYHAQLPVAHPAPTVVADPVAAGVHEIPVRRGRVVASLLFLSATALVMWAAVIGLWSDPHRTTPVFLTVVTVITLAVTLLVLFVFYAVGPALRRPVAARFTPDGWEIPPLRISGSWEQVRSIRVRPLAARGTTASSPQLAAYRMVALIVDNPEQRLAHLGPLRRRLIRSNITRYGSPVAVVASPRRTLPVVEMVRLLQSYTSAPVDRT